MSTAQRLSNLELEILRKRIAQLEAWVKASPSTHPSPSPLVTAVQIATARVNF